jgi:hypothetical protein
VLTVIGSTFSDNMAFRTGGGIYNDGTLTVTNSTFSGNWATNAGSGIFNGGLSTVINSTFLDHGTARDGGDIYNRGTLTVINSIIAGRGDYSGDGCVNQGGVTGSHNLIDNHNTCGLTNGVDGNIIGDSFFGDPVNPLLGPLADNGGSTLTFLPLPGSPVINAGDNAACPAFDQRGVKRPQGAICDIGSVESLIWPRARLIQVMR